MANGSSHEGPARGDRTREKYEPMFRRTQQALDRVPIAADLPAAREEMDSGEIDLAKLGVKAKGIPSKALGAVLIILSVGAVVAGIIKLLLMK